MRVRAHGEEVEEVVEIDLPVPLGVRRERQVDTRQLARDVAPDQPLVLLGGETAQRLPARDGIRVGLGQRRPAPPLPVGLGLRLERVRLGGVEQEGQQAVSPAILI